MARSKTHTYQVREGFHTPLIRMPTLQETLSLVENLDPIVTEAGGASPIGDSWLSADWDTATGTSTNAVTDGGVFTERAGSGVLDVVTGQGHPSNTNVLAAPSGISDDMVMVEDPDYLGSRSSDAVVCPDFVMSFDWRMGVYDSMPSDHCVEAGRFDPQYARLWTFHGPQGTTPHARQTFRVGYDIDGWDDEAIWGAYEGGSSPGATFSHVVNRWYNYQILFQFRTDNYTQGQVNNVRFWWRIYDLSDNSLVADYQRSSPYCFFWGDPDSSPANETLDEYYDIGSGNNWLRYDEDSAGQLMNQFCIGQNDSPGDDPQWFARVRIHDAGDVTYDQAAPWVPLP